MPNLCAAILGVIILTLMSSAAALAEKRVALVIGNSAYQNVRPLINPTNDAGAMSATLKTAGFDVVDVRQDLKVTEMRRALRDFSDKVRDADVAVVYYAGHGIEIDGTNYMIPVDAVLERDLDAFDEAIQLDRILTVIEPAKQLRLVILDACRDNPFNKSMKRTIGTRSIGRGLARVEPTSPNTLIAFAAKAGSTASDGDSKNSPFTAALVKYLVQPGLDLRKAFGFARDDVLKLTNNKQEPFVYGSLGGGDVSLMPAVAATAPPSAASPAVDLYAAVRRDYELALQIGTKTVWNSFIASYPSGFYADLAKAQRDKLTAEGARLTATDKAKAAQEEQTRLAIEGAKAADQARAAAQAKAAEQARVAAEIAKKVEDAKVAEAERVKAAALVKAAEDARVTAEKKKALEDAKVAEQKAKDDKPIGQVASLTPAEQAGETLPKPKPPIDVADIPRQLQIELQRVGCHTGAVGDNWSGPAQKSLAMFNKNANTKFDVKVASLDSLDAVKSKPARICPLICEHGYKADDNRCTKITCKAGFEVGDNNSCERIEVKKPTEPTAKRDEPAANTKSLPDKPVGKPATKNLDALYAQCRAKQLAERPEVFKFRYGSGWMNFNQLETCVKGLM